MAYQVLLHRSVLKKLKKAPENVRDKFRELIEELEFNPVLLKSLTSKRLREERTPSEFVWVNIR